MFAIQRVGSMLLMSLLLAACGSAESRARHRRRSRKQCSATSR